MVTIGMNYKVLPGKAEVFEKAFQAVLGVMKDSPGHTQSYLYRDVSDTQSYLIVSEWSDQEAFNVFIRSDGFRKVTSWGSEQILAGRPQHRIYQNA